MHAKKKPPTAPLAKAALAWDRGAFSIIAKHLGRSRQHVARVAHGDRQSAPIEKALRMAIARKRYP